MAAIDNFYYVKNNLLTKDVSESALYDASLHLSNALDYMQTDEEMTTYYYEKYVHAIKFILAVEQKEYNEEYRFRLVAATYERAISLQD